MHATVNLLTVSYLTIYCMVKNCKWFNIALYVCVYVWIVPWIQLNSDGNLAIKTLCWFPCSPSILCCSATLTQRFTSTWLYREWIIMMFQQKINIHRQSRQVKPWRREEMRISRTLQPLLMSWPQWLGAHLSHLSPTVLGGQIHWPVLASQLFPTWAHWHAARQTETESRLIAERSWAPVLNVSAGSPLCCGNISVIAWQKTLQLEGDGQIYTPSRQRITLFLMKWTQQMKTVALTGQACWHPHSGTELKSKSHCLMSDWLAHNLLLFHRSEDVKQFHVSLTNVMLHLQ